MKSTSEIIKNEFTFNSYELERNFDEACKDETFKKLISKIKLPKSELIKYTSRFKDSADDLKHCSKCKNIMECKNELTGLVYYPDIEGKSLIFSYVPCKYKKKIDKDTEYQKNILSFDMPKELLSASMKNIYIDDIKRTEAIKWITIFIDKYKNKERCKGLYLTGNFGCGKTYLVAAAFNELAKKGFKVVTVYYPEFLRKLKGSFSDDFNGIFDKVKKADLLLLDDIGAETTTNWNRDEILGTILQYRMQENKPTFFTSNLSLEELELHLSSNDEEGRIKARRIIERIKYLTDYIEMITENKRK